MWAKIGNEYIVKLTESNGDTIIVRGISGCWHLFPCGFYIDQRNAGEIEKLLVQIDWGIWNSVRVDEFPKVTS